MKDLTIQQIRQFHRFYLPKFHLLGNRYLDSEYSAAEARVLFEIYNNDGCTAALIADTMNIDKSYLSRIIRAHEKRGYLYRQPSPTDGRAFELHLTDTGRARTLDFIEKSNRQAAQVIEKLSDNDCKQLMDAFRTITRLLEETP